MFMKRWISRAGEGAAPRRRQRAVPAVERFEDRILLSGNVVAEVADGSLRLAGDDLDNLVEVAMVDGDVVVQGIDGTTVNGNGSFVAFQGTNTIPEDLISRLGKGDDTLIVSTGVVIGDDLIVSDPTGVTTLGLDGVVVGDDVYLRSGNQADEVSIASSQVGDDFWFMTRDGGDLISVYESHLYGSLLGLTADGDDDLVLQKSEIEHSLRAMTGKGDDDVVIQQTNVDSFLSVWTWRGDDFVLLEESNTGRLAHFGLHPGEDIFVSDEASKPHSLFLEKLESRLETRHPRLFQCFQRLFGAQPQRHDDVDPGVIEEHVTNSETGAIARADALREEIKLLSPNLQNSAPLTLTFDLAANSQTIESNGTFVTKLDKVTVIGETTAFAEIEIGRQGGTFPAAATSADENGQYSVELDLDPGQQTIVIQATDSFNQTGTTEFEIYRAIGSVVRFSSSLGNFDIELYDVDAPLAVNNFLSYQQEFENSIIHRAPPAFVIQGGGFVFENGAIEPIVTDPPIVNEFDPTNSNVRGTLSMALLSGQPDSGTSGWFINVVDNLNLDAAQHTVFGRVIGDGMDVVDAISSIPIYNLNPFENPNGGAFASLPLINYIEVSQPLTGTVNVSAGGNVVTGTGSSFTTELSVGDKVRIGDEDVFVLNIVNDTEFTILPAHIAGVTDVTAFINPDPTQDNLVLFSSISEIL